jgi:hypothetical protein
MRVFVVLLVCFLAATALAKKRHHKKHHESEDEDNYLESEAEGGFEDDPCAKKHCGEGKECDLDDDGQPTCVCIRRCVPNSDERMKVCTTHNVTFESDCEMLRQRCLCHHDREGCQDPKYKHAKLDYYGECRQLETCDEEEMKEFPNRMRDWLYLVMEELADRDDLNEPAKKLADEARRHNKRWVLPVIWKFCDLDISHDRMVDIHELVPMTAPLKALEHCTAPFLEKCDSDGSGNISLEEWGTCLGLDPEDIEDKCEALRED